MASPATRSPRLHIDGIAVAVALSLCALASPAATLQDGLGFIDRGAQRAGTSVSSRSRLQRVLDQRFTGAKPVVSGPGSRLAFDGLREQGLTARTPAPRQGGPGEVCNEARTASALSLRWQNQPVWQRTARSYRHAGLPIIHLWESQHALVAVGLSRHGVPGIYLTQKLAN